MITNPEDLPPYLTCDACPNNHYLAINRNVNGKWQIAYVDFSHDAVIHPIMGSTTLKEATVRMGAALERQRRRVENGKKR